MKASQATLTLSHPQSGWDGTHAIMLSAMADVLEDGPVDALLTYWEGKERIGVTVSGQWTAFQRETQSITLVTEHGEKRQVWTEDIESLSI